MIVEILETCTHTGIKKGHIYKAEVYRYSPDDKVTLLQRLTKKDRRPIGKDPECNEYRTNIKIIE